MSPPRTASVPSYSRRRPGRVPPRPPSRPAACGSPPRLPSCRRAKAHGRCHQEPADSRADDELTRLDNGEEGSRCQKGQAERPRGQRVLDPERPAKHRVGHRLLDDHSLMDEQQPVPEAGQHERDERHDDRWRKTGEKKAEPHQDRPLKEALTQQLGHAALRPGKGAKHETEAEQSDEDRVRRVAGIEVFGREQQLPTLNRPPKKRAPVDPAITTRMPAHPGDCRQPLASFSKQRGGGPNRPARAAVSCGRKGSRARIRRGESEADAVDEQDLLGSRHDQHQRREAGTGGEAQVGDRSIERGWPPECAPCSTRLGRPASAAGVNSAVPTPASAAKAMVRAKSCARATPTKAPTRSHVSRHRAPATRPAVSERPEQRAEEHGRSQVGNENCTDRPRGMEPLVGDQQEGRIRGSGPQRRLSEGDEEPARARLSPQQGEDFLHRSLTPRIGRRRACAARRNAI